MNQLDAKSRGWRVWPARRHVLLITACSILALSLLMGCQGLGAVLQSAEPTPIIVTEVIPFDNGEEVIITVVVTPDSIEPTPTVVPTIPVPESIVDLDLGVTSGYGDLDPQIATGDLTVTLIENLYIGLTRYDVASEQLMGELATGWRSIDEGRVWEFDLRDDVSWVRPLLPGDGLLSLGDDSEVVERVEVVPIRPVTAADAVFAVQRACQASTGTPDIFILFIIDGCQRVYGLLDPNEDDLNTIGVRAVSDTRVEFRLTRPAAWFPSLTTLPLFRPIPAEVFADEEVDWLSAEAFTTSGPFVLSPLTDLEAEPRAVTVLQRNPYWPAELTLGVTSAEFKPIERVTLQRFSSRFAAWEEYDLDQLDVIPFPRELAGQFFDTAVAPPSFISDGAVFYLGFNFENPAFAVPEVRRAFAAAIDRDQLIEDVYGQRGLPMRHFAPPGMLHAPPIDSVGVGFSPDYAFFQLAQSGYGSCLAIGPIRYLIDATDIALQHAEALIRMWVDRLACEESQFQIEQVQFGTLLAYTRKEAGTLRPDIWDLAWASYYPDAHDWFDTVLHCNNSDNRSARECDQVDGLINLAAETTDPAQRGQLYRQIESMMFSEDGVFPVVPLYVRGDYRLVQDWVTHISGQEATAKSGGQRFDYWQINQAVKDLERSQ